MFRSIAPLKRMNLSARLYHSTPAFNMSSLPADWKIIETSPGGVELDFVNKVTGESTWYTPEGMSATDILAIPDAKKYWSKAEEVEVYIKEKADEKKKNGGKDVKDA
ncbi:hypothetical protein GALMADRAFT_254632 [Galerina marginata CBS 339.88]|uniref:WW domain-containing protein n=1 Tax=Galerina marginata (strain CBS 339.88) TaxID=685588 RepID=A0A067SSA8_GALM3|nr:hypothetical protein GALMADRAFT_254632 [Galerina marginata CBS 339.88]